MEKVKDGNLGKHVAGFSRAEIKGTLTERKIIRGIDGKIPASTKGSGKSVQPFTRHFISVEIEIR